MNCIAERIESPRSDLLLYPGLAGTGVVFPHDLGQIEIGLICSHVSGYRIRTEGYY